MTFQWLSTQIDRPTTSLADQAYTILRKAILSLEMPPGTALVEAELSKAMGTSPTPIREALRRLQSDGLVTTSYARHVTVRGLSLSDIRNMYEVRAQLEPWAVGKCVPLYDDQDFSEMEQNIIAADEALTAGDLIRFSQTNAEFHRKLCKKCGNDYLLSLLDNIAEQNQRIRIAMAKHLQSLALEQSGSAVEEHWRIFEAVKSRDVEKAAALVYADIIDLLEYIETGKMDSLDLILNPSAPSG